MEMEQLLAQQWQAVMPYLIVMCLIAGFVGAMIFGLIASAFSSLEGVLLSKAKAKRWAKAQADKQAALSCGDDAAGRACETGGGSAA